MSPRPGIVQHSFARAPQANTERAKFNRSHGYKTTFDGGLLIPVLLDWILPGDTVTCNMEAFARVATLLKPIMDNMYLESFFFFVPDRLVWTNFVKMMGEQTDPDDSIDYVTPQMPNVAGGWVAGTLGNYFGLPSFAAAMTVSALPFRAYNLIWNEWFRDQNLSDSAVVDKDDGPDDQTQYFIRRRGKRHDYFTSCLPWPQKGDAVVIPLGATAPVNPVLLGTSAPTFRHITNVWSGGILDVAAATDPSAIRVNPTAGTPAVNDVLRWETTGLVADLSLATAASINSLRQAFQIQKLLERDARGGTRYIEIIRSHFGVISPDARLQRPEYLGGGSTRVNIQPVPQTSTAAGAGTAQQQANLAAFGTASIGGHGFHKSFTEHGIVIGLVCVRADLTYQQGIERPWDHSTRYDRPWPVLMHIGEQAVLNKEIYAQGSGADDEVFGYQERYGEYRYKPSRITGKLNSTDATPLDVWHLSQEFSGLPTLSESFILEDPPIDRISAVATEPHFIFDSFFHYIHARPMPVFGVPGLIDHF